MFWSLSSNCRPLLPLIQLRRENLSPKEVTDEFVLFCADEDTRDGSHPVLAGPAPASSAIKKNQIIPRIIDRGETRPETWGTLH